MLKNGQPGLRHSKPRKTGTIGSLLAIPSELKLSKHKWRLAFGRKPRAFQTAHFKRWQLQEAKAKFSELFERAFNEGPQVVTRHNKDAVVILAEKQFRKLAEDDLPQPGMLETLLKCPKGPDTKTPRRDKLDNILNLPPVFE